MKKFEEKYIHEFTERNTTAFGVQVTQRAFYLPWKKRLT